MFTKAGRDMAQSRPLNAEAGVSNTGAIHVGFVLDKAARQGFLNTYFLAQVTRSRNLSTLYKLRNLERR